MRRRTWSSCKWSMPARLGLSMNREPPLKFPGSFYERDLKIGSAAISSSRFSFDPTTSKQQLHFSSVSLSFPHHSIFADRLPVRTRTRTKPAQCFVTGNDCLVLWKEISFSQKKKHTSKETHHKVFSIDYRTNNKRSIFSYCIRFLCSFFYPKLSKTKKMNFFALLDATTSRMMIGTTSTTTNIATNSTTRTRKNPHSQPPTVLLPLMMLSLLLLMLMLRTVTSPPIVMVIIMMVFINTLVFLDDDNNTFSIRNLACHHII